MKPYRTKTTSNNTIPENAPSNIGKHLNKAKGKAEDDALSDYNGPDFTTRRWYPSSTEIDGSNVAAVWHYTYRGGPMVPVHEIRPIGKARVDGYALPFAVPVLAF